MKKRSTVRRVFLVMMFALALAAAAAHASDVGVSEEEVELQNAAGEWHRAVWLSVATPEFGFSVVRVEVEGGELRILLLPEGDSIVAMGAAVSTAVNTKEEDHEVDPDPKREGGRTVSRWTAQVSFTAEGARTKEEDHEVDPDPKSGDGAASWTRRLRFETAASLGEETQNRREWLEWFLAEVLPAGEAGGRFRWID